MTELFLRGDTFAEVSFRLAWRLRYFAGAAFVPGKAASASGEANPEGTGPEGTGFLLDPLVVRGEGASAG